MPRKKPAGVFVVGILQMIFGGMGFAYNGCCGIGGVAAFFIGRGMYQSLPPEDRAEFERVIGQDLLDSLPGLLTFFIVSTAVSWIMTLIQFISGVGLVKIRSWGRWWAAGWGFFQVFVLVGTLVYNIAVFTPAMEKVFDEFENMVKRVEDEQRKKGQQPPPRQPIKMGTGNAVVDHGMTIAFSMFTIGYAGFVLVFMALPATGEKIARYNSPVDDFDTREKQDYYDDDFERRRRGHEPPETGPPPP